MMQEKLLGSFSFDVAKRMLDVLSEHGISMKKTNLASKAGLNYNVCLRYIRILNSLGWVEVNSEVSITEIGKGVFTRLLDDDSSARASTAGGSTLPSNMGEKSIKYLWSSYISSSTTQTKPASTVTDDKQTVSESKQKNGNSKKKTIMIVDDEEDIAQTYASFLSSVGYDARTFIDSSSALHEYLSNPFRYDLLVLDIRMQGINGLQLYQCVKAINPECKAIFVSALDAVREVISILPGTKPRDIIRKPVSKEQFVTVVKTAVTSICFLFVFPLVLL
jgi:CheY-like chemotaxis protein/predicted transcriptional regulator